MKLCNDIKRLQNNDKIPDFTSKKKNKIGRKSSKSSCPNMIKTMELSSKV